jgi:hypothetical protein
MSASVLLVDHSKIKLYLITNQSSYKILRGISILVHKWESMFNFDLIRDTIAINENLFLRGDVGSITQLLEAFNMFSAASGLRANQDKSSIYFGGVVDSVQETILTKFRLTKGELPFKYLGVPLSSKKLTVMQCQPLVNKIISRIGNWSSKSLSYAGRLQLIKSVLFGVQTYWSQVFALPQKVLKLIQTACRVFLWTSKSGISKRALIAWEHICLPKSVGEWNVINLKCWNQAALSKHF